MVAFLPACSTRRSCTSQSRCSILAAAVESWNIARRKRKPLHTTLVCLYFGAAAAVVATLLGWANADAERRAWNDRRDPPLARRRRRGLRRRRGDALDLRHST